MAMASAPLQLARFFAPTCVSSGRYSNGGRGAGRETAARKSMALSCVEPNHQFLIGRKMKREVVVAHWQEEADAPAGAAVVKSRPRSNELGGLSHQLTRRHIEKTALAIYHGSKEMAVCLMREK